MPTTEERLATLEARVDRTNDLLTLLANVGADMNRQFADMRAEMHRQFGEVRAEIATVRQDLNRLDGKVDRDFRWVVGIQTTAMLTALGLLAGAFFR